jgi:hypothetical protein
MIIQQWTRSPIVTSTFVTALFTLCATLPSTASAANTSLSETPDSYEFKLLLKNSEFSADRDAAIDAFLKRVKTQAEAHGLSVSWKDPAKHKIKQREIRYLDSGAHTLNKSSDKLIFRTRTEMKKSCQAAELDTCTPKKAKVTLKQRFGDGVDQPLLDLTPDAGKISSSLAAEVGSKRKFERDYSWTVDDAGEKVVLRKHSLSFSVTLEDLSSGTSIHSYETFADLMALYPKVPWANTAVTATEALVPTCKIASTVIKKVGKVNLDDGNECDASFTFWRNQDDQTVFASEFSYTCDHSDTFAGVQDKAEEFYKALMEDPFVDANPSTKTAIAYACAPSVVSVDGG